MEVEVEARCIPSVDESMRGENLPALIGRGAMVSPCGQRKVSVLKVILR